MDNQEYRTKGKELIDFIGDYLRDIRKQRVFPNVTPGYMRKLLPDHAPDEPEAWDDIMQDVKTVIIPGVTHWQSPYMHAYFPALNSYPSLLGDMIADAINCLGFTWASSPACTELETIVMDWLGKMIGLPSEFLHSNTATSGGGVIQTTASESTFVSILAARTEAIRKVQEIYPEKEDSEINGRLIAYCSDQAHSSVEKAGLIGLVRMRYLASDDGLSLRGGTLCKAIIEDREAGFIPFYLCASLGTTGACAFDNLAELGPICAEEEIYLHIDAAYSGSAFICPEYRFLMEGVEYAQSFAFNPSKWLMVHFDCTAMWIKDSRLLHRTFNVDPLYLKHENSGEAIDYMHWQIGLSKRFRSLKLWCVLRSFGVTGLQNHIRKGVELAKMMEKLILSDPNFEIPAKRYLGLVVFRLKGENELTETLLKSLNSSGQLHMVPASLKGTYIIRFTVTSQYTTEDDIKRDWSLIVTAAREVVIKQGGLWIEEIEESVEVEVSEDESGLGDELQYTGSSDVVVTTEDGIPKRHEPSVTFKMTDGAGISTTGGVGGSGIKVRRTKMVPRKQMSVVFDPRASARRRATAASAAQYIPESVSNYDADGRDKTSEATLAVKRGSNFGVSLLLSNTPHSPQFINGSYAAIFENPQVVDDIASHLRRLQTEYSPWRQGPPPPTKTIESPNYADISATKENESQDSDDTKEDGEDDTESDKKLEKPYRKSKSSLVFKKAIENLFETYDSTNKLSDSTRQSFNSATHDKSEARRAAFKHLGTGRQYSLDSRLSFYSRAINDISAAAKAAVQGEAGSLKPQRRELGVRVLQTGAPYPFDKTSEAEDEDEPDAGENDVASPPDDVGGTVCTEDCYPEIRVKEDSLSNTAVGHSVKEEEIDHTGQGLSRIMAGTSLRRRRRIIDPPTHVPALPRGGVSGTNDALAKVLTEKIIASDSVGVQVEESMLPFEDQPFSSPYITAPNYVGATFESGGEEKIFDMNSNDKMVEVNVNNQLGWAKVKRKLVNTAAKNEFGTSKELEWESTIPHSNRPKPNENFKIVNNVGGSKSDNESKNDIIKKSFSNSKLSYTFCETPETQKLYSQYNANNNNTNEFEGLQKELYLMLNLAEGLSGQINFVEPKIDVVEIKNYEEDDEPTNKQITSTKKDSLIAKLVRLFGSEAVTCAKNVKENEQTKMETNACAINFVKTGPTITPLKGKEKFRRWIPKRTTGNSLIGSTVKINREFFTDENMLGFGHPFTLDYNNNLYIECDKCGHKMVPNLMNYIKHMATKAGKRRSSSLSLT